MAHTPEPWEAWYSQNWGWCMASKHEHFMNSSVFNPNHEQARENMERAAACVNACEGINPEDVPKLRGYQEYVDAKIDIEEVPFRYAEWLEIENQEQED